MAAAAVAATAVGAAFIGCMHAWSQGAKEAEMMSRVGSRQWKKSKMQSRNRFFLRILQLTKYEYSHHSVASFRTHSFSLPFFDFIRGG